MTDNTILKESVTTGKKKHKYDLFCPYKKVIVDRLIMWEDRTQEIIDRAHRLFNARTRKLQLFLNDELIYQFQPYVRKIHDIENDIIFDNIGAVAEYYCWTIEKTKYRIRTQTKFKWVNC